MPFAKELIQAKANVNVSNGMKTPLLIAIEERNLEGVKLLLANGADAEFKGVFTEDLDKKESLAPMDLVELLIHEKNEMKKQLDIEKVKLEEEAKKSRGVGAVNFLDENKVEELEDLEPEKSQEQIKASFLKNCELIQQLEKEMQTDPIYKIKEAIGNALKNSYSKKG